MSVLYRSDATLAAAWARCFARHAPDLDFRVWPDAGDLAEVEYLIAWQVPADFFAALPRLKVLFTSGYSEHFIGARGNTERIAPLLGKPYRRQSLAAAVRAALDAEE